MYCYEDRITDELIEVIRTESKICNYIDIPIQHASDRVLKAMRRRSTGESIKNTIKRLKEAIPDIHIRTTLITGIPRRERRGFRHLAGLCRRNEIRQAGGIRLFTGGKYSCRGK